MILMEFLKADISIYHYLLLSTMLFSIGVVGLFMNRKSIITILMSIELMLLAVNINFVSFSIYWDNLIGQIATVFILSVAAAEAAIGLAILVVLYRNIHTIDVEKINKLHG